LFVVLLVGKIEQQNYARRSRGEKYAGRGFDFLRLHLQLPVRCLGWFPRHQPRLCEEAGFFYALITIIIGNMCYRCQICNVVVLPKNRCIKVTTQTRVKRYPVRQRANPGFATKNGRLIYPLRKSKKERDRTDDSGGTGIEIVKELAMCSNCAEN
jgi:hypothetical protein